MRKNLKLIYEFFCGNTLKAVALLIIITSTCIIICSSLSRYIFSCCSLNYFNKLELLKSDYVIAYSGLSDIYDETYMDSDGNIDIKAFNEEYSKVVESDIYKQIETLSAVDKVYSYTIERYGQNLYNDTPISLIFGNMDTHKFFSYNLSDGCWFWDTEQTSEYPNAVLCGSIFENVKTGSNITITYNAKTYTIHVIGKVSAPYQTVEFTGEYSMSLTNDNKIFFLDNEMSIAAFSKTIKRYPTAAIVQYKEDATEKEIKECREFYKSVILDNIKIDEPIDIPDNMAYETTENMLEFSNNYIQSYIQSSVSRDTIFILIAAFMSILLAVMMVKSKFKEYCIYYFCGCAEKKTFLIFALSVVFINFISGFICSVYMMTYSYLLSQGQLNLQLSKCIFSTECYVLLGGYLLINIIISCIIPFIILKEKKLSLINFYKKENE